MREIRDYPDNNRHESGPRRRKAMRRVEALRLGRFLTFSCDNRLSLFSNPAIRTRFADYLNVTRRRSSILIRAWVVMPEHVHLLLKPTGDEGSIVEWLTGLKREFAREVIGRWKVLNAPILPRITDHHGRVRFWQRGGGYDRLIYSHEEFWEKVDYIHRNPVERGLVAKATDWRWSSARAYAGLDDVLVSVDIDTR